MMRPDIVKFAKSSPDEHGYFGVGSDGKVYFLHESHVSPMSSRDDIREAFGKHSYEDIPITRESRTNLIRALAS